MRRLFNFLLLIVTLLCFIVSCTRISAQEIEIEDPSTYEHVIILAFDGWGASSFEAADMPFLKSKLPKSAWTTHKRSILPTSSACNWATMFKGVGPEAHGYIAWNTRKPEFDITYADERGNFPSLFSLYRKQYPFREMGYLYQWEGMKYIFEMSDFSYKKEFPVSLVGSESMKEAAIAYIKEKKPGLAFFVWDYPDKTGHTTGWYTEEYMTELNHVDAIIKDIVDSLVDAGIVDNTLIVITSDHGGHDQTHHQPLMSDLETPFIMFGKRVKPGEIQVPLMQYDVASILADYLYIEQPIAWRGKSPTDFL